MKKGILFFIMLLSGAMLQAQNIKGELISPANTPVEYATVVLQTPDSVYVSATVTDSLGVFRFESGLQSYRLIIQHLLYNPVDSLFKNSPDAGTIQLQNNENSLSEAVIKADRPIVKVINGTMTYDMPQLLDGKIVSNAYESLLQLPGVVEMNDALTLNGASSLAIIINGKPSTMSSEQLIDLLKNTPKERIQKAEVMYSAPPQYHIRGAAINLVLSGATSEKPSLQGQINADYSQYYYSDYKGGVSLLYSAPKISTDFMYSFGRTQRRSGLDLLSHHLYNGNLYDIEQVNRGSMKNSTHNIRLGNDFELKGNNKLSVIYTGQVTPSSQSYQKSQGTYSNSENLKEDDSPVQMHNASVNYSSGFGLSTGADYTFYKSHTTQNYEEKMTGKEDAFAAKSKQDINRLSLYADQSHKLEKEWELNYGAKFIYASDESSQTYESLTGKDLSASNSSSHLKEYTYNAYLGFKKSFTPKLSASASLTGEYYKHKDFEEWSLFPACELTYVAAPAHIFQLSVSSDKTYPEYWEMTNAISYVNGYTEIHGNPALRPYKDYSLQMSYILKSKYIFTLYANHEDDYFVQLPYQSSEKLSLIYKTTNFDFSQKMGLNMIIPFRLGSVLNSRLILNGFYDRAKSSHFHDTSFDNDGFAFFGNLNNTFNISSKPDIKAELTGSYITKSIQGPSSLSEMYKVDAGLKWTFANTNAELRLKANDMFNTWMPDDWAMTLDKQNLHMHVVPDSRYISLSFTYKFGGYKEKQRKGVDTSRFKK